MQRLIAVLLMYAASCFGQPSGQPNGQIIWFYWDAAQCAQLANLLGVQYPCQQTVMVTVPVSDSNRVLFSITYWEADGTERTQYSIATGWYGSMGYASVIFRNVDNITLKRITAEPVTNAGAIMEWNQ